MSLAIGVRDCSGFVRPKTQSQAAFVSVINMAMPDESVNAGLASDLFPDIRETRRLQSFPVLGLKAMQSLFAENDATRLLLPK
jgi:hypothetical protein